jgi:hypothetical protein
MQIRSAFFGGKPQQSHDVCGLQGSDNMRPLLFTDIYKLHANEILPGLPGELCTRDHPTNVTTLAISRQSV